VSVRVQDHEDTIVALATPQGSGALGIIRLSGPDSIKIANRIFEGKDLEKQPTHTIHYGRILDQKEVVDEVLASIFIAPHSYTGEHSVEFSCHGSSYILQKIIRLLIDAGARPAKAGEFTQRAFLNSRLDLAQAEAVADLIASDNKAAHMAAMNQMRGGFSKKIKNLRKELVQFASLIELELDFAEEDVEFAKRDELNALVEKILSVIDKLIESFNLGNVIKNGVPTVIAGKPNTGKSTLLNQLLNEEKAIVSDIPGTTRDVIEDKIHIGSICFRFIDTAGIREARDKIEAIGVQRTHEKMKAASVIIYLFDLANEPEEDIKKEIDKLNQLKIPYIKAGNKEDLADSGFLDKLHKTWPDMVFISAKHEQNLDQLRDQLLNIIHLKDFDTGDVVVTNARHYESLTSTRQALTDVLTGLKAGLTNDFLALDLRQALHNLGEITGEITTDDLLDTIFRNFCIGK
jgi:tRNA modification GTPase